MIHPVTTLSLSSKHRVSQITFHPSQPYVSVQSHDRSVEIFRIRTEEEVRKVRFACYAYHRISRLLVAVVESIGGGPECVGGTHQEQGV